MGSLPSSSFGEERSDLTQFPFPVMYIMPSGPFQDKPAIMSDVHRSALSLSGWYHRSSSSSSSKQPTVSLSTSSFLPRSWGTQSSLPHWSPFGLCEAVLEPLLNHILHTQLPPTESHNIKNYFRATNLWTTQ